MNEETNVEVTGTSTVDNLVAKVTAFITEKKDKVILFGGIALVVLLVIIFGSVLASPDKYERVADYKNRYYTIDDDVLVNLAGKTIECEEDIYDYEYSADGTLTVVQDVDDTLWVVKGSKLVMVDEEVYTYRISTYGDTIVYYKEVEDNVGELYLYDVAKKKSTELSTDAYYSWYDSALALSPDGKSVAFLESDKEDTILMVSKNGKEAEELEENAYPVAISNNAKYVYYQTEDKFMVNDEKIESKGYASNFVFNSDATEVLYSVDGNTNYYTVKSGDSVKVKGASFGGIVLPSYVISSTYRGVDTFDKCVLRIDGGLYYMYGKGEKLEKITTSYGTYKMSEDGKSLLYTDDDKLVYVKNVAKPDKADKIKKLDVYRLYASKDLKTVYFINDDDELCYLKKDEGVVIAKDIYSATYSDKYDVVYFLDDEELCYANKTKKSVKTITDDVYYLQKEGDYIAFDLDDEVCVMTGKSKFKNLEE